tara:strand:+ start:756 stop:1562 length:807 start_codon:yes stop_codon:yes gene_type:complete
MQETKLHFQRFEFKYLLTYQEFLEIKERIKQYVSLDGYAKKATDKFYEVVSLYYDSPKFYYYNEKMDGVGARKKIRLRLYRVDGEYKSNIFFEIKRKYDAAILKDRFLIDKDGYHSFMQDNSFFGTSLMHDKNTQKIIEEYDIERCKRSLSPKVLVSYKREPYIGAFNKNFRVTFDYAIRACESQDLFAIDCDTDVLKDSVIMEVKFNGILPYYIKEVIDYYNLERTAYSKYCNSLESCYANTDINHSRNYFFTINNNLLSNTYERTI